MHLTLPSWFPVHVNSEAESLLINTVVEHVEFSSESFVRSINSGEHVVILHTDLNLQSLDSQASRILAQVWPVQKQGFT